MKEAPTEVKQFMSPEIEPNPTFLRYEWGKWDLGVIAERYDDDGHAELTFHRPSNNTVLLLAKANLLDTRGMSSLANRLQRNRDDYWK